MPWALLYLNRLGPCRMFCVDSWKLLLRHVSPDCPGFQRCSEFVAQEFQHQAPLVGVAFAVLDNRLTTSNPADQVAVPWCVGEG